MTVKTSSMNENKNSRQADDTLKKLTDFWRGRSTVTEDISDELLTKFPQFRTDGHNIVGTFMTIACSSLVDSDSTSTRTPSQLPLLRGEVEEAICSLPTGKSSGGNNIPAELLKHRGNKWSLK